MNAPNKWFLHSSKIIRDYIQVTGGFHAHINNGLADWEVAHGRGEKPPPYIFRIFGVEIPPRTTWDVVLQSQLTDLLESNVLFELGFFYNEVTLGANKYVRYVEFAEADVPNFFRNDGNRLLPKFESHMDRLREYNDFYEKTADWAKCLLERLEKIDQSTRSAAPTLESRCSRQLASAGPSHILRAFLQTPN